MCYTFRMPQRVISLPVVWIYIHTSKMWPKHCPSMWPSSFICVCVRHFQTTGNFRAHLWCPTACLHNIFSLVFVMYLHPLLRNAWESHVRSLHNTPAFCWETFCHSIQHCLEVLLEMGPPWFSWRLSQIELAHVCFASTCSHKRHSHHHILTRGSMHRDQSSQPLGVFLQSLTTKCQPDLQLELVTVTCAPGFFFIPYICEL